jgi:hypothetical protein
LTWPGAVGAFAHDAQDDGQQGARDAFVQLFQGGRILSCTPNQQLLDLVIVGHGHGHHLI